MEPESSERGWHASCKWKGRRVIAHAFTNCPTTGTTLHREPAGDPKRTYVRVTGTRAGGFIEFDFAIGTPDLFVELILPKHAFGEFCRMHHATELATDGAPAPERELGWRVRDAVSSVTGDGRRTCTACEYQKG
jgi:phenol/toluene 2-monooxygenase (NADH) P0/A0